MSFILLYKVSKFIEIQEQRNFIIGLNELKIIIVLVIFVLMQYTCLHESNKNLISS